jgi:hypothetical protein
MIRHGTGLETASPTDLVKNGMGRGEDMFEVVAGEPGGRGRV